MLKLYSFEPKEYFFSIKSFLLYISFLQPKMNKRLFEIKMKREHILEFVYNEFTSLGIKGVSVDDIAAKLHISKKTLYEMFCNKEKLLLSTVEYKFGKIVAAFDDSAKEEDKVLCKIIRSSVSLFKVLNRICDQFYEDIKAYPEVIGYVEGMKDMLYEKGRQRFLQGIEEGYLREDTDFEIVGSLLHTQITQMKELRPGKYSAAYVCYRSLLIILRGVCTEKGRELLDDIHGKELEEI